MLRRFALLGDIHAEDRRLALALTWLKGQAIDAVLAVGDLADGDGDLDHCCALLAAHRVLGVCGNHDRWLLGDELRGLKHAHQAVDLAPATLAYLAALPATRRLATVRGDLLLGHGVGPDDMVRLHAHHAGYDLAANFALADLLADPSLPLVAGGHTHHRMVRAFDRPAGPPLVFINPGTLHRDHDSGFAVVDLERAQVAYFDLVEQPDHSLAVRPAEVAPLPGA
ncbi:metallophosphoesterase family protein [Nannocystis bainbridge]|uniref:Metallophosphoesterase family protein n=1 Tax=Nannocystis bainbridge TaxID=2995303 RepID=A0ABT5E2U3_9BACT|nr:metallophosphoesterase family protein [Nannocystis bainbridge]MDC0720173.1 metallophosphoesterase family protein [Nannocystis bainbridge]